MSTPLTRRPRYRIEATSFTSDESASDGSNVSADALEDLEYSTQRAGNPVSSTAATHSQQQTRFLLDAQRAAIFTPALQTSLDPQSSSTCQQRIKRLDPTIATAIASPGFSSSRAWFTESMTPLDPGSATGSTAEAKLPVRPASSTQRRQDSYSPMAAAFLRHSSEQSRPPLYHNEDSAASLLLR